MKALLFGVLAAASLSCGSAATFAHPPVSAAPGEVQPPLRTMVTLTDGTRIRGWLQAYDDEGFDFRTSDNQEMRVAWADVPAERVLGLHERLLERGDAEGWFNLARRLLRRDDGADPGERALRRAVRAEPAIEGKADRLRAGEDVAFHDPDASLTDGPPETTGGDAETSGGAGGGPITAGELQAQFWGELSDEVMADSVAQLKAKMIEAQRLIGRPLVLHEEHSDYFLFYSDLPPREAAQWARLLDDMYDRLCEIFGIDEGTNVFRGRGLITVFARQEDFQRYHALVHNLPNTDNYLGLCWSFGDGHVDVTFFKQEDRLNFARVLVHEAVHAFVHRYRSYPHVPSWINEGLAEYVAHGLVEERGFGESDYARNLDHAVRLLRQIRTLGGASFFYSSHIQGWQYPVAQLLTDFMIRSNRKRYRAFIDAIKDGKPWDRALVEDYGVTVERLVDAFGQDQRIRDLRP
ncbi:MAG: hypothetical protein AAF710_10365 [Planctomycetota bacterium]